MLVTWAYHFRNSLMEKIDPRARWIFSLLFLFTIINVLGYALPVIFLRGGLDLVRIGLGEF